jgi:hypothetical protein
LSLYDRFSVISRGTSPEVLADWSNTIELQAIFESKDSDRTRVRFKGAVDEEGKFALDVAVRDSEAMNNLLKAIQQCLPLMPTLTREFYGALMISLSEESP